jgi:hypothetical protein
MLPTMLFICRRKGYDRGQIGGALARVVAYSGAVAVEPPVGDYQE